MTMVQQPPAMLQVSLSDISSHRLWSGQVIVAFVSKFNFWNDINVLPVVDVGESVPIGAASVAWARSASKSW